MDANDAQTIREWEIREASFGRRLRKWWPWLLVALLPVILLLWLQLSGPPSNATLITRFNQNAAALVSLQGNEFVSPEAGQRWVRALRIKRVPVDYRPNPPSIRLYTAYSSRPILTASEHELRGYAFIPDGVNADSRIVDQLSSGPAPFGTPAYQRIDGNWYLFAVRIY